MDGDMTRTIGKLTALKVERAKRAGMYGDGGGLYLRVTQGGARNWVYRYMLDGKPHWMGLGPLALYGLAEARGKALEARRLRHEGLDPIEKRRAERLRKRLEVAKAVTFSQCAEAYIKAHRAGWRNAKHAAQWEATLATYADPIIGTPPVQAAEILKLRTGVSTVQPDSSGGSSFHCNKHESGYDKHPEGKFAHRKLPPDLFQCRVKSI
jgi:hypothetical protein